MDEVLPQDKQFKRAVANKIKIGDLLQGKPIFEGDKFKFLELGNKQIVRVNIVGNIIEKYVSDGERKFGTLTIDDASGQIRLRVFGEDISKIQNAIQGATIMIIGTMRFFNNELYVLLETIQPVDIKYLLIRKLETEKQTLAEPMQDSLKKPSAIRDKIIDRIKSSDEEGGIDLEKLIMSLDASAEIINQEIQKLLEDGIIFEPRPGKVRYLG